MLCLESTKTKNDRAALPQVWGFFCGHDNSQKIFKKTLRLSHIAVIIIMQ